MSRAERTERSGMNGKKKGKRTAGRIAVFTLLIAGVLSGAAAFALKGAKGLPVTTAEVRRETFSDSYTEEGRIRMSGRFEVAAEVSGPVKTVDTAVNERVSAGDILFTVDDTDYTAARAAAESALEALKAERRSMRIGQLMSGGPAEYLAGLGRDISAAEAAYRKAETDLNGIVSLRGSGVSTAAEEDTARAAYESARASYEALSRRREEAQGVLESLEKEGYAGDSLDREFRRSALDAADRRIDSAEAELGTLREREEKCVVRAPKDGIVTALPVKDRTLVQAGQTAVVMNAGEEPYAEADILTEAAPFLRPGTPVEAVLHLRGTDRRFPGAVSEVCDYAEKDVSALGLDEYRVHVKACFEDTEGLEGLDGYGVNLTFRLFETENALILPSSAVFEEEGARFVYRIENGRAVKTPVTTDYASASFTVISGGVSDGERVIDRVDEEGLRDGVKVEVSKQR